MLSQQNDQKRRSTRGDRWTLSVQVRFRTLGLICEALAKLFINPQARLPAWPGLLIRPYYLIFIVEFDRSFLNSTDAIPGAMEQAHTNCSPHSTYREINSLCARHLLTGKILIIIRLDDLGPDCALTLADQSRIRFAHFISCWSRAAIFTET